MNTAAIAPQPVTTGPIQRSMHFLRFLRIPALILAQSRTAAERDRSREELALLHERRQEAARLREAAFHDVVMLRGF